MTIETFLTKFSLHTYLTNLTLRSMCKHKLFDRNLAYRKQLLRQCNRRRAPVPPPIFFHREIVPTPRFYPPLHTGFFTRLAEPPRWSRGFSNGDRGPLRVPAASVCLALVAPHPSAPVVPKSAREFRARIAAGLIPSQSRQTSRLQQQRRPSSPTALLPVRRPQRRPHPHPWRPAAWRAGADGGRRHLRRGGTPRCAACWTRSGGPADRGDTDGGGLRRGGSPCQGRLGCQ